MDPYTDLLRQQRTLSPPPGAVDTLEQQVMARLDHVPKERRRRLALVGGVSLCCVLLLLVVFDMNRPRADRAKRQDFVESIVILDNHVCIWLNMTQPNLRSGHFHE
jgi:hypothetical protein